MSSSDDSSLPGLQQIVDFAICIERCGDMLAGKVLTLRLDRLRGTYQFTEEGNGEIAEMVEAVRRTIILAHETAWTGDALPRTPGAAQAARFAPRGAESTSTSRTLARR